MADPDMTGATVTLPFASLSQLLDERTTGVDEADLYRDKVQAVRQELSEAVTALDAMRVQRDRALAELGLARDAVAELRRLIESYIEPPPSEELPPTEPVVPVPDDGFPRGAV